MIWWLFISKDTMLASSSGTDKDYMLRQKKVLTERGEKVTIINLSNNKHINI